MGKLAILPKPVGPPAGTLVVNVEVPNGETADIESDGRQFSWSQVRGLGVWVHTLPALQSVTMTTSGSCVRYEFTAPPGEYSIGVARAGSPACVTKSAKVDVMMTTEVSTSLPPMDSSESYVLMPKSSNGKVVTGAVVWISDAFGRTTCGLARCFPDGTRWLDLKGIASRLKQTTTTFRITVETQSQGSASFDVESPFQGVRTVVISN